DYVKIYLEGKDAPILSLMSLKAIEEKLSDKQFMRVHRSFIIQLNKIEVIDKGRIIIHDTIIPVADNYRDKFKSYLSSRSIDF
ncbi:MAG: LytTR family transcriptional regulator, partial [Cytophagales bacterium]|nr:LytTR family transcriptional regulator [Cytophaga sp.]